MKAGHTEVPSASVILDDPNLLFVNAGMVQFVPYFLGQQTPPYPTATSIQKCIRTPDIDEVGVTTRHNTFFQMAGNFSFGDYFKRGAIELAWKLLTNPVEDGGYGLEPEKIWATVYLEDDEAAQLWQEVAGLPPERIQRRGMGDNFWSMGIPARVGRRRRSTTTAGRSSARKAVRWSARIATSSCGIWCSWKASVVRAPRTSSRSSARCRARTSTPAWVWSASRACCRACPMSMRPTCCGPSSTRSPRALRGHMATTAPPKMTCATASSPTTAAPRRS
ncbi:tRNA synthetases class II family protein [Mycobacterium xenopi 3993]|nr:tRNA synthetases class II family protein [Mycobacterium xenopi 3993]